MKQNNTNMLFKSLALCFLILGNLTSEVLCDAHAAVVELKSGEVAVPKGDVCTAINSHYKVKSSEDFFSTLVTPSGSAEYKFPFNSTKTGQEILKEKIDAAIVAAKTATLALTATDAFNAFTAEVAKITKTADDLKKSVPVTADALQTFMSNFEFKGNKFVLNGTGSGVTLNDIPDNLVVYLKGDLPALEAAVKGLTGASDAQQAALIAAEEKLADAKAATDAKAINDATAALDTAKGEAIGKAKEQAKAAVIQAVLGMLTTAPASASTPAPTPTSIKDLLDALNKLHIKTEYEYVAATTGAAPTGTGTGAAPTAATATATVKYSIVAVPTSLPSDISSAPLDIKATDIGNDQKFLPQFIDTKNVLANNVFLAISDKCTGTTTANDCFKAILQNLKTKFSDTVDNALSTVVLEKTVLKADFNTAFASFATESAVNVQESDIKTIADLVTVDNGNCKVNLHWLSTVTEPLDQFKSYITWLESAPAKLESTPVADKAAAINAFFKVLQDNLAGYKTQLEKDLESSKKKEEEKEKEEEEKNKKEEEEKKKKEEEEKKKKEEEEKEKKKKKKEEEENKGKGAKPGKSNVPQQPKSGMSKTTKTILISVGGVALALTLGGAGFFTWKFHFNKDKV